jgi:prepilin-type N-terminal cleavage/methylation domain-containing protein
METVVETLHPGLDRLFARRRAARGAGGPPGLTLLEIMIVLAILALVMGLLVGPKVMAAFGQSKIKTTKIKLTQYANEAFPQWSANHPDKACPEKLSDLNENMNSKDTNDSWGRPIKMLCGANLPAGVKGLGVVSAGEDGKEGTEDDLKSWDE